MKLLAILVLFTIISCNNTNEKKLATNVDAETTYYLIRHSEKDRSDKTNRDPELREAGKERARGWASYFSKFNLDAIYATNYNRTQQTAAPTAIQQNIKVTTYTPNQEFIEKLVAETKGKNVLVVGHSNTTPMLANGLLQEKKFKDINDTINSVLFTIKIKGDKRSVVIDTIN